MKKIASMLLFLALVLSMGVAAFAEPAPVTINYVTIGGAMDAYLDDLVNDYIALYPHVTFNKTLMENEQHRTVAPSIMSGPGAPDFIYLNTDSGDCPALVDMGALEPLDKYYEQYDLWDHLPQKLESHRIKGNMYHFSVSFATAPIIFYNKAIFKEVGIEVPKTYPELVGISGKLRDAGYQPLMFGDRDGWPGFHMYNAIVVATTPIKEYEKIVGFVQNGEKMADYQGFAHAFDIIRDMEVNKVWADGALAMNGDEAQSIFVNRQAGIFEMGPWSVAPLREALGDDLGYFWFPKVDETLPLTLTASYADEFCMSAFSSQEVKNEVAKFFAYVLSVDGQRRIAENSQIPISTAMTAEMLDGLLDPMLIDIVLDFSNAENVVTDNIIALWGNELYAELRQQVQNALNGTLTSAEIVTEFDKLAEKVRAAQAS